MRDYFGLALLGLVFIVFISHNLKISLVLKHRAYLEGRIKLVILGLGLVFIVLSYLGGNELSNYMLSGLALAFVYSGLAWQGLSSKGVYYRSRGFLIRHIGWEEIISYKLEKNRLRSLRVRKINIYVDQVYDLAGLDYIRSKIGEKD